MLQSNSLSSVASNYELPEEGNENCLKRLGKDVEMKTFTTNEEFLEREIDSDRLGNKIIKILCIGGVGNMGVLINDYLQVTPPVRGLRPSALFVDQYLKRMKWLRNEVEKPIFINLRILEIGELGRVSSLRRILFKDCHGALVFWETLRPSSLNEAVKWRKMVMEVCPSVPCVFVTDNLGKELSQWIGAGKTFESELALNQFCHNHGLVSHFEIVSRDWVSGEKSVFGQAVNCLMKEIFQSEQTEEETSM